MKRAEQRFFGLITPPLAVLLIVVNLFAAIAYQIPGFHNHEISVIQNDSSADHDCCHDRHDSGEDDSPETCPFFVWHANTGDSPMPIFVFTLILSELTAIQNCFISSMIGQSADQFDSRAPPIFIS